MSTTTGNKNRPLEGGVGASDGNNGGGAASGVPDADVGMQPDAVTGRGDVAADKKKLFPDSDPKTGTPTQ